MKKVYIPVEDVSNVSSPIFIVGGSRSGTSLLASMLNSHSRIACGPETQLLNKIKPKKLRLIIEDPNWPSKAVQALGEIILAEQRVVDIYKTDAVKLYDDLSKRKPGVAALFEALVGDYAKKQDKPRWAEKTPRHLLHVDVIRQAFPSAKIIRILRDPRDSALSMRQLPWASDFLLPNFYLCCAWFENSNPFFVKDDEALTIKYEDLIAQPDSIIQLVCDFIGESYQPEMLNTSQSGRDVRTPNEKWKEMITDGITSSRVFRWKKELSPAEKLATEFIGEKWINLFGYESVSSPQRTVRVFEFDRGVIERESEQVLGMAVKGIALLQTSNYLSEGEVIFSTGSKRFVKKRYLLYVLLLVRWFLRKKSYVWVDRTFTPKAMGMIFSSLLSDKKSDSLEVLLQA